MTVALAAWRTLGVAVGASGAPWWPVPHGPPAAGVLHGASAGEVKAARALLPRLPGRSWTVSSGTAAGLAAGADGRLPRDVPRAVRAFFDRVRPERILLVEGELWPALLEEAQRRRVPVGVVGARITARSFARWRQAPRTARALFGRVDAFAAASDADAERIAGLGVAPERVAVGGWLKWPDPPTAEVVDARRREAPPGSGPLVVAGSTHPGELSRLAAALRRGGIDPSSCRWVVVPRHARALPRLRREARALGPALRCEARFGVLRSWYGAADLAFVGGGACGRGSHDLLEPLAVGRLPLHFADLDAPGGPSDVLCARGLALRLDGRSPADPTAARTPPPVGWPEIRYAFDGRDRSVAFLARRGVLPSLPPA